MKEIKEGVYERIWRKETEGKLCNCIISKNKKNKNSQDIKKEALATCSLMRLLVREHDIFEFNKCKPFTDFSLMNVY